MCLPSYNWSFCLAPVLGSHQCRRMCTAVSAFFGRATAPRGRGMTTKTSNETPAACVPVCLALRIHLSVKERRWRLFSAERRAADRPRTTPHPAGDMTPRTCFLSSALFRTTISSDEHKHTTTLRCKSMSNICGTQTSQILKPQVTRQDHQLRTNHTLPRGAKSQRTKLFTAFRLRSRASRGRKGALHFLAAKTRVLSWSLPRVKPVRCDQIDCPPKSKICFPGGETRPLARPHLVSRPIMLSICEKQQQMQQPPQQQRHPPPKKPDTGCSWAQPLGHHSLRNTPSRAGSRSTDMLGGQGQLPRGHRSTRSAAPERRTHRETNASSAATRHDATRNAHAKQITAV